MAARWRRHSCRVWYYTRSELGRPEREPGHFRDNQRTLSHSRDGYFRQDCLPGSFALELHRYDVNKYFRIP